MVELGQYYSVRGAGRSGVDLEFNHATRGVVSFTAFRPDDLYLLPKGSRGEEGV